MKKLKPLALLISGEFLMSVFILSGYIKSGIGFPVDLTFFLLAITIGLYFIRMLKTASISREVIVPILLFLLFLGYIIVSFMYSDSHDYALQKTTRFLLLTAWSFIGPLLFIRDKQGLDRFLLGIVFISSLMTFYCLQTFITNIRTGHFIGQIDVLGSDYLSLGRTNGIAIIALIGVFLYHPQRGWLSKLVASVFLIASLISISVSGARMPLVSLLITILLILILSVKIRSSRFVISKGMGSLVLIIAIIAVIAVPVIASGLMDTFLYRMSVLLNEPGGGESASGRVERYIVAWNMIQEHFFFGGGIGSFTIAFAHEDVSNYPHNVFLEIWSELGLVGITLFLFLLIGPLRACWQLVMGRMDNRLMLAVVCSFIYLFLNANISGDLNENRMFFTFIGLCWLLPYLSNRESNTGG